MRTVPREAFVPEALQESAYDDGPLPIGEDQTISQPYVVAAMTRSCSPSPATGFEIGTGSGYAAAVLATIVSDVYTGRAARTSGEGFRAAPGEPRLSQCPRASR